jgi:diguanylate cyclase (GGDEF)-like protein
MDTMKTEPVRLTTATGTACLVHIYPSGPQMGTRYPLGGEPFVLGRDPDSGICIADRSVSRQHARIWRDEDGYVAEDLQSTNGTFINDAPISSGVLRDGDYLRVGNCIYRFLMGGNVEAEYHEEIYRLTIIDPLTGAHNKRYLTEFLDRELTRAERYGRPLALIAFDIDHFKTVNDELGHLAGDFILRELAGRLRGSVRTHELLARAGGEEFAVVLPETTREGAVQLAERMRQAVAGQPFFVEGDGRAVTISLGVAATDGESVTAEGLMRRADENLYRAKHEGRNRVVG